MFLKESQCFLLIIEVILSDVRQLRLHRHVLDYLNGLLGSLCKYSNSLNWLDVHEKRLELVKLIYLGVTSDYTCEYLEHRNVEEEEANVTFNALRLLRTANQS